MHFVKDQDNSYPQETNAVVQLTRDGGHIHPLLFDLLTIASPYDTHGEDAVRDVITRWCDTHKRAYEVDRVGNVIVRVGKRREHRTLFSSHMDTVHLRPGEVRLVMTKGTGDDAQDYMVYGMEDESVFEYELEKEGEEGPRCRYADIGKVAIAHGVKYWSLRPLMDNGSVVPERFTLIKYEDHNIGSASRYEIVPGVVFKRHAIGRQWRPSVLGADDKLGCYIMCRMIEAKVEGLYVFHVGEESGCIGSTYIASKSPGLLKDIDRAIAFDRANYGDVIGEQAGSNCASGKFCTALAAELNRYAPAHQRFNGNVRGVWTDTASYVDLVPECTNISVGYFDQHTATEHFDLIWLEQILLPALLRVDWTSLPTHRDPTKDDDFDPTEYGAWGWGSYSRSRRQGYEHYRDAMATEEDEDEEEGDYDDFGQPRDVPWKDTKTTADAQTWVGTEEDADYWREKGVVPPWCVNIYTPPNKIPDWNPSMGVFKWASDEQMKLIIKKWIVNNCSTVSNMASLVYDLSAELSMLKTELLQPAKE